MIGNPNNEFKFDLLIIKSPFTSFNDPTKFFPLLRKMPEMPELEPCFQPNLSFSIVSKPIFKTSLPEL